MDDIVMGFQHRAEAERIREFLVERLRKCDLGLNSEKTRLIQFGRWLMAVVTGYDRYCCGRHATAPPAIDSPSRGS